MVVSDTFEEKGRFMRRSEHILQLLVSNPTRSGLSGIEANPHGKKNLQRLAAARGSAEGKGRDRSKDNGKAKGEWHGPGAASSSGKGLKAPPPFRGAVQEV